MGGTGDLRIFCRRLTDLFCALNINVQNDISSPLQPGDDFAFKCAVTVGKNSGVFQKFTLFDLVFKLRFAEKKIVFAVNFARPGCRVVQETENSS